MASWGGWFTTWTAWGWLDSQRMQRLGEVQQTGFMEWLVNHLDYLM